MDGFRRGHRRFAPLARGANDDAILLRGEDLLLMLVGMEAELFLREADRIVLIFGEIGLVYFWTHYGLGRRLMKFQDRRPEPVTASRVEHFMPPLEVRLGSFRQTGGWRGGCGRGSAFRAGCWGPGEWVRFVRALFAARRRGGGRLCDPFAIW